MQRDFEFSIDEFYHLYTRGVEKRVIFLSDADKERFVKLLYVCNSDTPVIFKSIQGLPLEEVEIGEKLVAIGTYCLMPNHIHLLIKEIKENGISKFMSKLLTAYSMYFNKKHEHSGRLFENTFKAEHADNDRYLKYLFAYIHLNPAKIIEPTWKEKEIKNTEKIRNYLKNYKYSSYFDYSGIKRSENLIINPKEFPEYFKRVSDFNEFINEWLAINSSFSFQG